MLEVACLAVSGESLTDFGCFDVLEVSEKQRARKERLRCCIWDICRRGCAFLRFLRAAHCAARRMRAKGLPPVARLWDFSCWRVLPAASGAAGSLFCRPRPQPGQCQKKHADIADAQRWEESLILQRNRDLGLRGAQKRGKYARPVGKISDQCMYCACRGQIQNAADQNQSARLPVLGQNLAAGGAVRKKPGAIPRSPVATSSGSRHAGYSPEKYASRAKSPWSV